MRIGVNALYLIPGGVGGTEIYLRSLLAALGEIDSRNRYFVFTNRETGPGPGTFAAQFRSSAAGRAGRFAPGAHPLGADRAAAHGLAPAPGRDAEPRIHRSALLPLPASDRLPRSAAQTASGVLSLVRPALLEVFPLLVGAGIDASCWPISDPTAADLRHFYRLPETKLRVVPLGVDPVFFEIGKRRRPDPFLLSASTLHPHKNLDGLLRAFAGFREVYPEFRLIACGIHGFFTGPLVALRKSLGLEDSVEFPGWIPRQDLYDLYARAWAFVYPSKFEGFGLPVLEALAAGVPTVCSQIEPLAGIAGGAALLFDPLDPEALTGALLRLVEDCELRERLSKAGPRRAAMFSWRITAEATLEALAAAGRST